jgi:hypothetical protein
MLKTLPLVVVLVIAAFEFLICFGFRYSLKIFNLASLSTAQAVLDGQE